MPGRILGVVQFKWDVLQTAQVLHRTTTLQEIPAGEPFELRVEVLNVAKRSA